MDDGDRARLEAFLDQVRDKTDVQFAVLTLPTTAPMDPAQYKTEVYRRWFQGNRTSLLLLVAIEERRITFETGYDLEGILPDGLEARVIREEMTPRFRAGNMAEGIEAGVLRIAAVIAKDRGVTLEWNGRELRYRERGRGPADAAVTVAVLLLALILVMAYLGQGPSRRGPRGYRRGIPWWMWPGSGSGGGWGGGDFGGGFGGGGGGFGGFSGGGGFGSGGGGGSGGW